MGYNFDQIVDRRNSDSAKWKVYSEDVVPLWVADMDFESPAPIRQALIDRVQHNVFGYGWDSASFRQVLVERMQSRYDWSIQPSDIVFLPGLVCGLNVVSRAIGQAGDGVLVNTPVYPPFLSAPTNQGKEVQTVDQSPTLRNGHLHYEVDFDAMEQAIRPHTKLFILCNPHNPTGRAYNHHELQRMAEISLKHNLIVCSDEIHCDLLLGGSEHIPLASLDKEIAQQSITLMAPSKTFNVPGLGCSFAIVQNESLRKQVEKAASGIVPHVNVLGMAAAEAAYSDPECDAWLVALRQYLTANRDFLVDYVDTHFPNVQTTVPQATYLAWLDWRNTPIANNAYKFFLDEAKVALNNGLNFGQCGAGFVRVNMGCPRATLEEGLQRMRQALSNL